MLTSSIVVRAHIYGNSGNHVNRCTHTCRMILEIFQVLPWPELLEQGRRTLRCVALAENGRMIFNATNIQWTIQYLRAFEAGVD